MKDQHKKIKGYRDLTKQEIDLMNKIKEKGGELGELINEIRSLNNSNGESLRWCSIAKTNIQQGLMALTRSVAKPNFF